MGSIAGSGGRETTLGRASRQLPVKLESMGYSEMVVWVRCLSMSKGAGLSNVPSAVRS